MPEKIIAATLQVNTGTSNTNIKDVNKNLGDVKKSLSETGSTAKGTAKDIDITGGSFGKLKDQMTSLPGPLGSASAGVGQLSSSFKALLANPVALTIVAIVAALALLYKAFTNTFAGGQKMEQVFAGIKAAGQALIDNLNRVGRAIKDVFSFDFSGALDEIEGVADAATDAYNKMADLTKQAQDLHREQLTNDLEAAEREKKLALLREQANDDSISPAERKKALLELRDAAQKNSEEDIRLAKKVTDNKIAQLTLEKDGELKNQDEITAAKIEQIKVETDNANELRRIGKQITAADREEIAARKAAQQEAAAEAKIRLAERKKDIDTAIALEKLLIGDNYLAQQDANEKLLELERRKHAENLAILKKGNQDTLAELVRNAAVVNTVTSKIIQDSVDYTSKINSVIVANAESQIKPRADIEINQTQLEKDNADARMKISELETEHRRSQIETVSGILNNLTTLFGKQTLAGKAVAIAEATINTYLAASKALTGIPKGNPLGAILAITQAAVIIATGIKNVKAIAAVQVPGAGGSGGANIGSVPNISTSAPIAPSQQGVRIDQDSINNFGSAVPNNIRAYMVESDVANQRERTERINRAARLGG